jgi:hypothetical protein
MKTSTATATSRGRIPMILTGQALRSLRDSGHSLPTALGEPIDNSIEAKANTIHVQLDENSEDRSKKYIHQIAIADDGMGMDETTLHHYLQLGFSTRYMGTESIGKYGVGAKLAALNFARRIDVWSRQSGRDPWLHVYFDLDEATRDEETEHIPGIDAPEERPIPPEFSALTPQGHGTLVVWSRVDRLEEGRWAENFDALRLEVEKELARIFRYFIEGGIKVIVNGKALLAHDPLFLMTNSWADHILNSEKRRHSDTKRKASAAEHYGAQKIAEEPIKVGKSKATLRVTLYPTEVTRKRYQGGDELAGKLRVPENLGCISFVRLDREVSYTNVPRIFPRGVQDPDRFIGIEVSFKPDLDEYFGVRNVKRGVEPHGDLREKIRTLLAQHVKQARAILEERWGKVARDEQEHHGEHIAISEAAKEADRAMPKGRAADTLDPAEEKRFLDDLANDVVGDNKGEKQKYLEKIQTLPFVVESVDFPGNMFIDVQHVVGKVIIRINTRHRFYREMWEPLKDIAGRDPGAVSGEEAVRAARRTIEALTLLLIAYGKAESMDDNPGERYGDLKGHWGQFLDTLMGKVKNVI